MSETTVTAEALNDLRQRYLNGEAWTREELKDAIFTMIGDRLTSVQAAPKAKAAKATPVSLDDMLPSEVPKATEPSTDLAVTNKVHLGVDTGVKTATEVRTHVGIELPSADSVEGATTNKPAPKKPTGGFF